MTRTKIPNFTNYLLGLILILFASHSYGQNTHILISGIRSEKGQIILNIFKNSDDYEQQKVSKKLIFEKKIINGGTMNINCELNSGVYGISLIDDENKNGELNKNFIGIPKEGFGFSNFFMDKMKKPLFDDFKINITPQYNKITIKVKYM